jgi:hypothetical protein
VAVGCGKLDSTIALPTVYQTLIKIIIAYTVNGEIDRELHAERYRELPVGEVSHAESACFRSIHVLVFLKLVRSPSNWEQRTIGDVQLRLLSEDSS